MSTAEAEVAIEIAPPVRQIGFADAGLAMTVEEFDALTVDDAEDGYRYELIRGVLVVSPIPSEAEGDPNEELGHLLRTYKHHQPLGSALDQTLGERYVHTTNRRRADRVVWANLGRRPNPKTDVPTIVIEFVSGGQRNWRRDYIEKRREYLAAGVIEYWIVNRFDRTMTVVRAWSADLTVAEAEVYRTEILPGFELPLARLLAAADRWKD